MLNEGDVVKHVDNHLKPWLDAGRILQSGYLAKLGLKRVNLNFVNVIGECIQHSAPSAPPHRVKIALRKRDDSDEGYRILSAHCQCLGGSSGKCKHAVAVMRSLVEVSADDVEELSCTDDKCSWIKGHDTKAVQEEIVKIKQVTEFCHYTREVESFPAIPQYFDSPEYDLLTQGLQELRCSFLRHRVGVPATAENDPSSPQEADEGNVSTTSNLLPDDSPQIRDFIRKMVDYDNPTIFPNMAPEILELTDQQSAFFMEKVQVNVAEAVDLCSATVAQTNSYEWKRARKVRLTGYKCYELLTYLGNKAPDWEKKLNGILLSKWKGNANTEFGNKYEQVALNLYERKYDRRISYFGIVVNVNVPWLGFSPDGIILDDDGSLDTAYLLEVKCPKAGKVGTPKEMLQSLGYIIMEGDTPQLKKRHAYFGQVQLAMALSGIKLAELVLYHHKTKDVIPVPVPYDKEFCVRLIHGLTDVYFKHGISFLLKNINQLT